MSYGYVYCTLVPPTESTHFFRVYVGQKKSAVFKSDYFGSGVKIRDFMKTHGTASLRVFLLEWAHDQDDLNKKEHWWVGLHLGEKYCMNLVAGGNQPGATDESRARMSKAQKGKKMPKLSEERKKQIGDFWRGRKRSPEFCAKLSANKKGHVVTLETRRKISEACRGVARKPHSLETRQKIGAANAIALKGRTVPEDVRAKMRGRVPWNKGLKGCYTTEQQERMRASITGRRLSEEHKRHISEANTGKTYGPRSEQARQNMRDAWARKREQRLLSTQEK